MDKILAMFSDNEKKNREKINLLMKEWKKEVAKSKVLSGDNKKSDLGKNCFVADGFFPNYYSQTNKILFIGREARYISGSDIIEVVINHFKDNNAKRISFWRRILYILYGIKNNGREKFQNIPDANDIAAQMVESNDYGLAIMNFSKYSNNRKDGASANIGLINRFLQDSHLDNRNYFREELSILDPNIIITANLWDGKINEEYLQYMFGKTCPIKKISNKATLSTMKFNKKTIKIIDLYHFSRPGVMDEDYYYAPVMKLLYNT
jgi:hypothetical protein